VPLVKVDHLDLPVFPVFTELPPSVMVVAIGPRGGLEQNAELSGATLQGNLLEAF